MSNVRSGKNLSKKKNKILFLLLLSNIAATSKSGFIFKLVFSGRAARNPLKEKLLPG